MKHEFIMLYDSQCPLCAAGARRAEIDAAHGQLRCIDARRDSPERRSLHAAGLNLDNGVVVIRDGRYLQGAAAVNALALAAPRAGLFNRLSRGLFASPQRAARLYPPLLRGRNLLLRLLGRAQINA